MSSQAESKQRVLDGNPLGQWLRTLRQVRALPLRVVAAAAEMDTALLSKIELGQRIPTEKQTAAFAAFFGVPLEELEAKRIAERFWMENRDNPAAGKAVAILRETAPVYTTSTPVGPTSNAQSPAQPAGAAAGTQTQHQPQENHP